MAKREDWEEVVGCLMDAFDNGAISADEVYTEARKRGISGQFVNDYFDDLRMNEEMDQADLEEDK